MQMIDAHIPTINGRELPRERVTEPAKGFMLLLARLKLGVPERPPPKTGPSTGVVESACSAELYQGLKIGLGRGGFLNWRSSVSICRATPRHSMPSDQKEC